MQIGGVEKENKKLGTHETKRVGNQLRILLLSQTNSCAWYSLRHSPQVSSFADRLVIRIQRKTFFTSLFGIDVLAALTDTPVLVELQ